MNAQFGDCLPPLAESLAFGLVCCDADGRVCYANRQATHILSIGPTELFGKPLLEPFQWELARRNGDVIDGPANFLRHVLEGGKARRDMVLSVRRKGGHRKWIKGDLVPSPNGLVFSFIDVTGQRKAEHALSEHRLQDPVTALPNRALLNDRLHHATAIASRSSGGLALMMIDIDGFKEVNLAFGHKAGDEMLNKIGARLQETVRNADSVCRIAGDEFAVLLWGITSEATATYTANRILRALEQPFHLRGHEVELFASAGVAMYPRHGNTAKELTACAYTAMYAAKRDRAGCLVYEEEYETSTSDKMSLRSELRKAIAEDELVLYYQPKVAYSPGDVPCVEALVRWVHPIRGLVPPDAFIPLAEDSGLIRPLGDWVLNTALKQARAWLDAGTPVGVAVNLSMHNLQDPTLLDKVRDLLMQWDVPPALLKLEVTESSIASHPERVLEVLRQLQTIGIGMSIDDFGTGYSSLMQLKKLPVSEIKIDKSFVQGMLQNDNDGVIVRTTIDLGHNLGLIVVAEGVEDHAMFSSLETYGCDVAQGYYMARPMPADQLNSWLTESEWGPYRREAAALISA